MTLARLLQDSLGRYPFYQPSDKIASDVTVVDYALVICWSNAEPCQYTFRVRQVIDQY